MADRGPDRRQFGAYICPKCKRHWMSAHSWRDFRQECRDCKIMVTAYERKPLEKPEGLNVRDLQINHPRELCEKCKRTGRRCNE